MRSGRTDPFDQESDQLPLLRLRSTPLQAIARGHGGPGGWAEIAGAIVGGIVAGAVGREGIAEELLERREPLDALGLEL